MIFKKAILIIHGFAGGTYDIEDLANYLEADNSFDVYTFTLPGHDKNLSKVKHTEWISESENKINWLIKKGYRNIYIIGHSMGGVIASYLASKYKQVKKLVLAAPAFHYLNVIDNNINIKESLSAIPKVLKQYEKDEIIGRFLKFNITAISEFMLLVKKYYDTPKNIICPTLILQGKADHLVPATSSEYVYNELDKNNKKLIYIEGVNHDVCKNNRQEEIFEIIKEFLKHNTIGGIETI